MPKLFIDRLGELARDHPAAPLAPDRRGDDWRRLTNAEAWARSGAVASWLIAQGFGPGGRVLAVPPGNTPLRAVVLLGALRAGALVVEGPAEVEFAALAQCAIDASVAERRLHIDGDTPARRRGAACLTQGELSSIAQVLA
jgi:feruloyl-CoA synthase